MKTLLLMLCLLAPYNGGPAPTEPGTEEGCPKIGGVYGAVLEEGFGLGLAKGSVTITPVGKRYIVQYAYVGLDNEDGTPIPTQVLGMGLRKGDTFSVTWRNGNQVGLSVYTIREGRLDGIWSGMPGPPVPCRETLTFKGALPKEL